ncbi:uncharacterized protein N7482_004409 [Penicillium canariense]|uniref:Uncharacterized protein n=1 Tax=Penicillium canariense TaxID=189055 RepID=A0A9W9I934_9EURO|nr:uncharacterized protein N7482_004409 [Penicillium canariense]KAJ5168815.1 hypothetical protein N7482_004409 [Penicillium canariense]
MQQAGRSGAHRSLVGAQLHVRRPLSREWWGKLRVGTMWRSGAVRAGASEYQIPLGGQVSPQPYYDSQYSREDYPWASSLVVHDCMNALIGLDCQLDTHGVLGSSTSSKEKCRWPYSPPLSRTANHNQANFYSPFPKMEGVMMLKWDLTSDGRLARKKCNLG